MENFDCSMMNDYTLGIKEIDDQIGGIRKGSNILLIRPSMSGKEHISNHIIHDNTVKNDNYGNTIGHVLVFHDTIDQGRIENDLKMALNDWQNIFNAISDCVFILDMKGNILNTNGVFESMTGLKTDNIIGKNCYKVMNCSSDFIKYDPIEKIKQNRMRECFELMDKERRLRFQVTIDPIYTNSGEIIKSILIMRNVTGSKIAEKTDAKIQLKLF